MTNNPDSKAPERVWNEAIEAAASYHDEIFKHDSEGIEYSSLVGIPISNLSELEASCRRAEMDAREIRKLKITEGGKYQETTPQQASKVLLMVEHIEMIEDVAKKYRVHQATLRAALKALAESKDD